MKRVFGEGKGCSDARGFLLVEVLAAVCILSLGISIIFTSLFGSMDAARYCSDYQKLAPWLDEKLWEAQDELSRFGPYRTMDQGQLSMNGRDFNWGVAFFEVGGARGLFQINATLSWKEGPRQKTILRSMYTLYECEEE